MHTGHRYMNGKSADILTHSDVEEKIIIREATKEDFSAVLQFIELVDSEFCPPLSQRGGGIHERVRNTLATPDANYLIAQIKKPDPSDKLCGFVAMVGCIRGWQGRDRAYINFFATHPAYRKAGLGEILLAELETKLLEKDIDKVYLCTWTGNKKAMRFYEKLGYSIYSVILNDRGRNINTFNYRKKIEPTKSAKQ